MIFFRICQYGIVWFFFGNYKINLLKYFTTTDIFRSSEKLRSPIAMVWRPSSFVVRRVPSVKFFFSITIISIFTSLIGCFMGPGGQGSCKIGIFL